jgi:hypothetical protein
MRIALEIGSRFELEIDGLRFLKLGPWSMFVQPMSPRERGCWFDSAEGSDLYGFAWWDLIISRTPTNPKRVAPAWAERESSESGPLRAPAADLSECEGSYLSDTPPNSDTHFGH